MIVFLVVFPSFGFAESFGIQVLKVMILTRRTADVERLGNFRKAQHFVFL